MTTPETSQQSASSTFQQIVDVMQEYQGKIQAVQMNVASAADGLRPHYGAEDGVAFQQLLADWQQQVEQIKGTCQQMIDHVGTARVRAATANANAVSAIRGQAKFSAAGDHAFTTMMT